MENKSKKETGVVFILMRPNGELLLQLRDDSSPQYPNTWVFPGGGKEDEEKYLDAAIREANEECGVVLRREDCDLIATYSVPGMVSDNHVFVCRINGSQEIVINEGADMKWMSIDEVRNLKLGYKQEIFISELEEFLKNNEISD